MKSDSKKTENSGKPSKVEQEFHDTMKRLYAAQPKGSLDENKNRNDYYVAAKLPAKQYGEFFAFLESKGWSKATGIKFAIHQLLSSKNV